MSTPLGISDLDSADIRFLSMMQLQEVEFGDSVILPSGRTWEPATGRITEGAALETDAGAARGTGGAETRAPESVRTTSCDRACRPPRALLRRQGQIVHSALCTARSQLGVVMLQLATTYTHRPDPVEQARDQRRLDEALERVVNLETTPAWRRRLATPRQRHRGFSYGSALRLCWATEAPPPQSESEPATKAV